MECLPLPKTGSNLRKQPRGEGMGLTSCLKQHDYLVSSLPSGIRNERSWAQRTANNCAPDKMDYFLMRCCKGKASLHSVQWRSSLSGWQSVPELPSKNTAEWTGNKIVNIGVSLDFYTCGLISYIFCCKIIKENGVLKILNGDLRRGYIHLSTIF